MKAAKLTKFIKKLLNDNKYMQQVYNLANDYNDVYEYLASAIEYYVVCDGKCKVSEPKFLFQYLEEGHISTEEAKTNIKKNLFMTHSFNGCNRKCITKYGLGDKRTFNPAIQEAFEELECIFGASEHLKNQSNTPKEIYMTSMGVKSFHYASTYSPERLFLGILRQERGSALPIILGESKQDYFLRVLTSKINKLKIENKDHLLKQGQLLISYFCSKKPNIAFFSPTSKKYTLNVAHSNANNKNFYQPLTTHIERAINDNIFNFFTTKTEWIEENNLGNLVSIDTIIPASEISLLEVDDKFDIMTNIALAKGCKLGDKIDYFSGQRISNNNTKEKQNKKIVLHNPLQNNQITQQIQQIADVELENEI